MNKTDNTLQSAPYTNSKPTVVENNTTVLGGVTELDVSEVASHTNIGTSLSVIQNTDLGTSKMDSVEVESKPTALNNLGKLVIETAARSTVSTTSSQARGDDYPTYLKNAAPDSVIDPWRLYNRECTSFTAYRLSSVNKFTIPGAYGNGGQWGHRARREGYRVDSNPMIGSVAWLDDGGYGHVAWVSDVIGNSVEIEEYNFNWNHNYHKRVVSKSVFTGYIHFKDLNVSVHVTPPTPPKIDDHSSDIPKSGTYYFTQRVGIKSEPRLSSADIACYDSGQSVNYDKTLIADNYHWISYISGSGVRRYIAISPQKQTTPKTPTKPVEEPKTTIPFSGTYKFTDRRSVVAEPKMSSPELAYYSKGQSVNYDKTVDADGYKWISYIAGSGKRRYIAIQKLNTIASKPTTPKSIKKPNIPEKGSYTFSVRSSIKADPKMSSKELAYYDAGSSVFYDKVLLADGHYWISYIAASGNRRYISIA